jgi:sirohydrochlorin cobaltochelatase
VSEAGAAAFLEQLLASGATCIGEIAIAREPDGTFTLMHRDDRSRDDVQLFASANEIARYDDAGNYRPLKTAPNLRRGWRMRLPDPGSLARALEEFYPARLAALKAFQRNELQSTALRDTLARQSGMYRVASRISDQQLDELVGEFCRSDGGCLRTILWKRNAERAVPSTRLPPQKFDPTYDQTGRSEHAIPLLCQEACNLVVAAARAVVKGET